ncbi:unnamed protein product [Nezara viridula]|uniref:Neuropeptide n=1 Tax=Nezara viridula TaxID=85310 RepID=A0A9P0HUE7_NEZVI|nr:unnamed protein product [Nezara viridula]
MSLTQCITRILLFLFGKPSLCLSSTIIGPAVGQLERTPLSITMDVTTSRCPLHVIPPPCPHVRITPRPLPANRTNTRRLLAIVRSRGCGERDLTQRSWPKIVDLERNLGRPLTISVRWRRRLVPDPSSRSWGLVCGANLAHVKFTLYHRTLKHVWERLVY